MSDKWRVGRHRGHFAAVAGRGNARRRIKLHAVTREDATRLVRQLNLDAARLALPKQLTLEQIYDLYTKDREAEGVVNLTRIKEVGKTLKPLWGSLTADEITKSEVKRFTSARRQRGCSDGTIRSDLGYIRAALGFAQRSFFIPQVPSIALPPVPRPRERWLGRDELARLIAGAAAVHVRLFVILAICTAGRPRHLLQLTWDRVDFEQRSINLDRPGMDRTRKGRARVPINETALEALTLAREIAQTDYVIECNGRPLQSIKRGVKRAAERAGLKGVSQYVLRHTAGVYMAQDGVPMAEIAQYMGHNSVATTFKTYARFHPAHLQRAARSLEIGKQ